MIITNKTFRVKIKLKYIFYVEAVINFITFFLCLFFPGIFVSQLTDISVDPIALELARWYGVLLFVITFIMLGILILENSKAFAIVMIGYLIGDFAQIAVAIYFAVTIAGWSTGILITLILTLILVVFRLIVIFRPNLLGFKNIEKKVEVEE